MVPVMSLWLPILVSAVIVFVASSIIHMVLPYHKSDYGKVPAQDNLLDALRKFNIPPGDYMLPRGDSLKDMKDPVFVEKLKKGPVLMMTVFPPGSFGMGAQLVQWFVYCLVVGVYAAYVTGRAVSPATPYLTVFRFAGATAFACYAVALWQTSIWYRRAWSTTIKTTLDGLVYALLTGGTFGWLWPR